MISFISPTSGLRIYKDETKQRKGKISYQYWKIRANDTEYWADDDFDDVGDVTDGGAVRFLRRVSIGFCPGSAKINLQKIVKSSAGQKSTE